MDTVARKTPGLVLADIQLADGCSGIDAVKDILAALDVPVIFITAFPERLLTGERPEPTFLITKPFQPETVKAAIGQALFFHPAQGQDPAGLNAGFRKATKRATLARSGAFSFAELRSGGSAGLLWRGARGASKCSAGTVRCRCWLEARSGAYQVRPRTCHDGQRGAEDQRPEHAVRSALAGAVIDGIWSARVARRQREEGFLSGNG